MSAYYNLSSSVLRIKSIEWDAMTAAAEEPLDDYFDSVDFEVDSDDGTELTFTLEYNGEAGESFPGRIAKLMDAMGPYFLAGAKVTLREDTMADERDQVFFAGPTPQSIFLAGAHHAYGVAQQALAELSSGSAEFPSLTAAIDADLKSITKNLALVSQLVVQERAARDGDAPEASGDKPQG